MINYGFSLGDEPKRPKEEINQLLRIMKLLSLLLLWSCLHLSAGTLAQTISLQVKEQPLATVLKAIEKQSGYHILYNDQYIDAHVRVSLQAENRPLEEVLDRLLTPQSLTFLIKEKNIAIRRLLAEHRQKESATIMTQQRLISGNVTDEHGSPLAGVTVAVKHTSIQVMTDVNGKFQLKLEGEGQVLIFSAVGFVPEEVSLKNETTVDVTLRTSTDDLDEVVVVGFGTQKRTDMIGSVVSVKPTDLKVPSSNLTTAFAGRVAGMIAYQRSGEPGLDNADFFIRGVTTFGYKVDPLILIDNVEVTTTDLARLQVDDLASFSIMKDATATAIYGARGANGVILVTTKKGEQGKTKLSFRLENSFSSPTRNVELADPVTYMKLNNEAILTRDRTAAIQYPLSQIGNTVPGADPYLYPAVDWRKELIKDYTSNQRANLSISGGGKAARYYVSGAFNQDNGVLKVPEKSNFNNNINLKTYSLRANVDMDLTRTTQFIVRLNGSFDDYNGPVDGGTSIYRKIMRTSPTLFAPYYPAGESYRLVNHILFGNAESGNYLNPYADLVKGYKESSRSMMLAQLELKQDLSFITKGLSFRSLANTTRNAFFDVSRQYRPFFYELSNINPLTNEYNLQILNENDGTEYLDYGEGTKTINTVFYMENAFNYSRTFADKHNLSGLVVLTLRNRLDGNAGSLQTSLPYRNMGVSGRLTYSYNTRYFAEFNFGYNGSERFHISKRYGFFPSAGLAWSVSNEKFWEPFKETVSNLRLRATYGVVGNDAIGSGRFLYLSEVNMNASNRGAVFGTDRTYSKDGISMVRYANSDITWERAYKSNFALELGLFNKVQLMAEYFEENRTDILMARADIPSTVGLTTTVDANLGEAKAKGVDISIDYNCNFGEGFWLQSRGNFTYATSKYTVFEEPTYQEPWLSHIGQNLSQQWGYIAERLFIDEQDVANSPSQAFGTVPVMGGDIKYRDVNRDGKISSLDRVPIGYPTTPKIVYGFGFSLGYKNFDFSSFFQGSMQSSFWIDPQATAPFVSYTYSNEDLGGAKTQNQLLKAYADSHWSEDNRDLYALWPRLSNVNVSSNEQRSTWFMRNGAFLRVKQVEFGYTLPHRLTQRLKMGNFRIYANGTNLFTISGFKLWDVEMAGNGLGYPIQRVFNIGINASF